MVHLDQIKSFSVQRFKTFPFECVCVCSARGNHYSSTTDRNWILFWPQIFIYSEPFRMSSSGLLFLELRIYLLYAWIEKENKKPFLIILFETDYTNSCFLKQRLLNLYIIISSFLAINYFVFKAPCPQEFNRVWKAFFSTQEDLFVTGLGWKFSLRWGWMCFSLICV